jgi:hypothetical protein
MPLELRRTATSVGENNKLEAAFAEANRTSTKHIDDLVEWEGTVGVELR